MTYFWYRVTCTFSPQTASISQNKYDTVHRKKAHPYDSTFSTYSCRTSHCNGRTVVVNFPPKPVTSAQSATNNDTPTETSHQFPSSTVSRAYPTPHHHDAAATSSEVAKGLPRCYEPCALQRTIFFLVSARFVLVQQIFRLGKPRGKRMLPLLLSTWQCAPTPYRPPQPKNAAKPVHGVPEKQNLRQEEHA